MSRIPRSNVATEPLTARSSALAVAAAVTAGAFVVLLAMLHVINPGVDPSWRFVSEYQLGDWGWLMSVAFGCLAISALSLLIAVRSQVRTVGGRVGLGFLAISGLGAAMAAAFRSDSLLAETATTSGVIHNIGAVLGGFIPLAAYLLAWSLARNIDWRPYRQLLWWVTTPAIVAHLATVWQQVVIASGGGTFGPDVPVGWPNRLLVVGMALWLFAAAAMIRLTAVVNHPRRFSMSSV